MLILVGPCREVARLLRLPCTPFVSESFVFALRLTSKIPRWSMQIQYMFRLIPCWSVSGNYNLIPCQSVLRNYSTVPCQPVSGSLDSAYVPCRGVLRELLFRLCRVASWREKADTRVNTTREHPCIFFWIIVFRFQLIGNYWKVFHTSSVKISHL